MQVVVIVQRQTDLLEVILTLRSPGSLSRLLDCRKQQCDEDGDNGNDDEQFDQRESAKTISVE